MRRLALALVLALVAVASFLRDANAKPNFIIIYCDDLGYADVGAFGSTLHRTPHIDQMAQEGMRLTNFYSTCCVCTPSRASLMTGCYPKRISMHESERGQWVLFPGNSRGINSQETTIAEMLSSAGYATAIVGKWHLGDQPEYLPTRHGFDSYFGIPFSNDMGKMDRVATRYPPTPLLRNEQVIELEPDQRYLTQRYTEEAISFIESNRDRPFFLYLPHSMPHWPQYATKRFAGNSKNGPWGDAVEEIDWSTGRIFDTLKRLGIDENTLVVFASDNGGATHHGAVNKPLRGGKGSTWEGGQRVCCIARWPTKIQAGSESDQLAVTFDLLPTLASLANVDLPERRIDGKNIESILFGDAAGTPHEAFFYFFRGQIDAVRSGDWKLFVRDRRRRNQRRFLAEPELYHLGNDISETKNVAEENPEVVARLTKLVDEMRTDLGDGDEFIGENVREAGHVDDPKTLTINPPDKLTISTVYQSGTDGYHTFRIPSLVSAPWGTLYAFCEGRKTSVRDHGDIDLVLRQSRDHGQTWSDLTIVYEEGGDEQITIGNPCPVIDQDTGVIWLPFCRNNRDVLITNSSDQGRTWSEPIDITASVKKSDWGWYATGPGVGIQLTRGKLAGRLVVPCDHRIEVAGKQVSRSHIIFSDDHGKTWQLGAPVSSHTNECQVVELDDGKLMINMRNNWARNGARPDRGGKRVVATSDDGGETWQPITFDETLIAPICQASLIAHNTDTFRRGPLLFSNPASATVRERLTVRLSEDDGQTWAVQQLIHAGPAAYSCLSVLPDRSIGCLFECGDDSFRERIDFARMTIPWLKQTDEP